MASVFRKKRLNGKVDKVWRFRYKDYVGRWHYGTGWPDKRKTFQHASAVEAEHRAIRLGEKPLPSQRPNGFSQPIGDVLADYLKWGRTQGGRGGRPWDNQNAALKEGYLNWWIEVLGLDVLADVRLADVEKKVQEMISSGEFAPKTVALRVEALRCLCLWALRRGYLQSNPLAGLAKIDAHPLDPHRALNEAEIGALLRVVPPRRRLWHEVALATGYRVSELRALRVCDLDVNGSTLPLGAEFTKNRRDARQPITRSLANRLAEIAQGKPNHALLLDIPSSKAWRIFQNDLKAADIPIETGEGKATWHSLRKSYVNALIHSGADVKTVMELARHSCASLTMEVYASADKARLRQAAEAAAERIEKAIAASPCGQCVENGRRPKKEKVVRESLPKTYVGGRMVGATGFEPATPRPPV